MSTFVNKFKLCLQNLCWKYKNGRYKLLKLLQAYEAIKFICSLLVIICYLLVIDQKSFFQPEKNTAYPPGSLHAVMFSTAPILGDFMMHMICDNDTNF